MIGIVAVEGIGHVHFIRLGLVSNFLVLDVKKLGRVMHRAVTVVVIADRAVEQMIAEDPVKGFALRSVRARRGRDHIHAVLNEGATGSYQLAVHLHHAGVACLDRSQLGVVTNLRNLNTAAINRVDQALSGLNHLRLAVDGG